MRSDACQVCANTVHFENYECVHCGHDLGFSPARMAMVALTSDGSDYRVVDTGEALATCANRADAGCNWLVLPGEGFCMACRHNMVVPDVNAPGAGLTSHLDRWREIEEAKRRLFYALERFGLPHPTRTEDATAGLGFRFLADTPQPDGSFERALTGHDNGIITLNIDEADDALRTQARMSMGEPYRTLIGHLRHEIGHYYWDRLVGDGERLDDFRVLFGDEREDYAASLAGHYANGSRPGWKASHITAYASTHPWEDFAETWAHWMHIVDCVETAQSYGLASGSAVLERVDPYATDDADAIVAAFAPTAIAINAVNRSMGQPDLYPFVVNEAVKDKLAFVASLCRG